MNNPVYSPEFIPYYPKEVEEYGFTKNEAIIYGFIRFYTKNGQKFYFNNDDIARIADCSPRTVTTAIEKFVSLEIFEVVYANKANGGTIRFINNPLAKVARGGGGLAKVASPTSKSCESAPEVEKKSVQANNKKSSSKRKKTTTTKLLDTSSIEKFKEELAQLLSDEKNREPLEKIFKEQRSVNKQNVKITDQMKAKLLEKFRLFNLNRRLTKKQCLEYLYKFAQIEDYNKLYDQVHS